MNRMLRRTRVFGIISLGILSIGLWQFVLQPRFVEPENIQTQVNAALSKATLVSDETAVLTTRARLIDAAVKEANSLALLLPESAGSSELSGDISKIAASAGISPAQIKTFTTGPLVPVAAPPPPAAPAPSEAPAEGTKPDETKPVVPTVTPEVAASLAIYEMTITTTVEGSFSQLSRFVTGLNRAPRTLTLDMVAITPVETAIGGYSVAVTARAFVAKGIGQAPTPVAPQ